MDTRKCEKEKPVVPEEHLYIQIPNISYVYINHILEMNLRFIKSMKLSLNSKRMA
jgi:hypothetical protein